MRTPWGIRDSLVPMIPHEKGISNIETSLPIRLQGIRTKDPKPSVDSNFFFLFWVLSLRKK